MPLDLTYQVELSEKSRNAFQKFIDENLERKEVTVYDVFELISRAVPVVTALKLDNGKKLGDDQQKQVILHMYKMLVDDERNDFVNDEKISSIIDTAMKLKKGEFDVNLGSKGLGCLPCFSKVQVTVSK